MFSLSKILLRKLVSITLCALLSLLSACSTLTSSQNSYTFDTHNLNAKLIRTPQSQIEYYEWGHGSPIVLIAGYAMDISSWDIRFLNALAIHHRVIVFNNRNVGRSFNLNPSYASTDLANDTYVLIHTLHLHNTTLVGISMGGMIAQKYATLYPQTISHLVLINTVPPGYLAISPNKELQNEMFNFPRNKLRQFIFATKLFFPSSDRLATSYNLLMDRFIPQDYVAIDLSKVLYPQQNLLLGWQHDNLTASKLKKIAMPVLILNGKADIVIPPINSLVLKQTIPQSSLVRWQNGGHGMVFQFPTEVAKIINSFISNR